MHMSVVINRNKLINYTSNAPTKILVIVPLVLKILRFLNIPMKIGVYKPYTCNFEKTIKVDTIHQNKNYTIHDKISILISKS